MEVTPVAPNRTVARKAKVIATLTPSARSACAAAPIIATRRSPASIPLTIAASGMMMMMRMIMIVMTMIMIMIMMKPSYDRTDDCSLRPAITSSGRRPGESPATTTTNSSSTCGELRRIRQVQDFLFVGKQSNFNPILSRKNVTSLTEAESQKLETALKEMIDSGRFVVSYPTR